MRLLSTLAAAALLFIGKASAITCDFEFGFTETLPLNTGEAVSGSGTLTLGAEDCSNPTFSTVLGAGAGPFYNSVREHECRWPVDSVTGTVRVTSKIATSGTFDISLGGTGTRYIYDIQCNLNSGWPYALDSNGLDLTYTAGQPATQHDITVVAPTVAAFQVLLGPGLTTLYPWADVGFNFGYYETNSPYSTLGNFSLKCDHFQTADHWYPTKITGATPPTVTQNGPPSLAACYPSSSSSTGGSESSSSPSSPTPSSSTGGPSALGDPQFVGFLGQSFQVHGYDGQVYNIISDRMLQLNSKFTFLTEGRCPTVDGVVLSNCFAHPGSYFGALGFMTAEGNKLEIVAGNYTNGFAKIVLDGKAVDIGDEVSTAGIDVKRTSTHQLEVSRAGLYAFKLENSDMFINIVSASITDMDRLTTDVKSHGILGQTWRRRRYLSGLPIEGKVDDYAEFDNDLFGCNLLHNKFEC